MIKLKPIVNEILLTEEEQVTWAEVARAYQGILKAQNKETRKNALKFLGKTALSLWLAGGDGGAVSGAVDQALKFLDSDVLIKTVDFAKNSKDWLPGVIKATLSLGKSFSNTQLKNPKASEFKKLTGPFFKAIKLSDEVSTMLDDNVEAMFINQVLLPKLQEPGSANEPLPNMDELLGKWLNDKGLAAKTDIQFKGKSGDLSEATMNAQEMARHKKKLEKLKKYLAKQGDQMMAYPADLPNTVFNAKLMNEDVKNGMILTHINDNEYTVKVINGGQEVGKLNFIKSKFKPVLKATSITVNPAYRRQGIASSMYVYAEKELGMKFVKSEDVLTPDGKAMWNSSNRKFGQKPIKVKTGVKESISVESAYNKIDSLPQGKIFDDAKRIDGIFNKSKHSYSEVIEAYEKNKNNGIPQMVSVKDIHITQPNIQSNKVKQTITSFDDMTPLNVVQFPDGEMAIYDGHHRLTAAWATGKDKIKVNLVNPEVKELEEDFGDMERLSEIGEASAKVYKYKVTYEDPDEEIQYEFTTDSKLKYQISIAQFVPNVRKKEIRLVVAFKPEGKTYNTITNKGEQFRIMATVVAAVKEYLATVPNATEISFTPSKTDEGDMRRANLYKAYIAKQLPGSKIDIFSDGRYIVTLPKKKVKELTERLELFLEKNIPTDPTKWSYYKSQAKKKFDVYPSAYANAWAAKKYKAAGGGWRKSK